MNYLGIDYGEKRVGIALSRENGFALPFAVFKNDKNLFKNILKLCIDEGIDKVTVGIPFGLKGNKTDQTKIVKKFIAELKNNISFPIIEVDERMSSGLVQKMALGKIKREMKDASEAAVILQSYLDKR